MATTKDTKVKGVAEALAAVKGGAKKKATKKAPAKKKAAAKKAPAKKKATTKKKAPAKAAKKAPKKTAKKAPKKAPKAKAKAPKAPKPSQAEKVSSGQAGPALDLGVEQFSDKERKVLDVLNGSGSGSREIFTIEQLAAECWKSKTKKQANSWVRNSLRRLVRAGAIEKVERGQYRVSDSGRKKLARAEAA
jgi:hypothetical protein